MSSLVIVDRAEKLGPGDAGLENPLRVGEVLLYPNVGTPLSKSRNKQMGFYMAIKAKGAPPSKATVRILQKGQPLAELPVDLPAAGPDGNVQFTSGLPLEAFPPGEYDLSIAVSDGKSSVSSTAHFTVVP
jgi:hypothetical protein